MMKRVARRAMNRGMLQAWQQWWSTMQSPEEKAKLQRVARRALNKGLALGWTSWLEDYEETRRKKEEVRPRPCPPPYPLPTVLPTTARRVGYGYLSVSATHCSPSAC